MPVNFVLVAEGEEEIGSPHFRQVVHEPEVAKALSKCTGIFMPSAAQDLDGNVTIKLGAKGVVEVELISNGEKWGRGPSKDIHSSSKARGRQPGLASGAGAEHARHAGRQEPAIDGFTNNVRPLSAAEKAMIDDRGASARARTKRRNRWA